MRISHSRYQLSFSPHILPRPSQSLTFVSLRFPCEPKSFKRNTHTIYTYMYTYMYV